MGKLFGACRGCSRTIEGATYYRCRACEAYTCYKGGGVGCYRTYNYCPNCGEFKTLEIIGHIAHLRGGGHTRE